MKTEIVTEKTTSLSTTTKVLFAVFLCVMCIICAPIDFVVNLPIAPKFWWEIRTWWIVKENPKNVKWWIILAPIIMLIFVIKTIVWDWEKAFEYCKTEIWND